MSRLDVGRCRTKFLAPGQRADTETPRWAQDGRSRAWERREVGGSSRAVWEPDTTRALFPAFREGTTPKGTSRGEPPVPAGFSSPWVILGITMLRWRQAGLDPGTPCERFPCSLCSQFHKVASHAAHRPKQSETRTTREDLLARSRQPGRHLRGASAGTAVHVPPATPPL
jgi:hypothetical protein